MSLGIIDIQRLVGAQFGIKRSDLLGPSRKRSLVRPRQMAMVLSYDFTPASMTRIGNMFGGRDHTTVLHAYQNLPGYIENSPWLERRMRILQQLIMDRVCLPEAQRMCADAQREFENTCAPCPKVLEISAT